MGLLGYHSSPDLLTSSRRDLDLSLAYAGFLWPFCIQYFCPGLVAQTHFPFPQKPCMWLSHSRSIDILVYVLSRSGHGVIVPFWSFHQPLVSAISCLILWHLFQSRDHFSFLEKSKLNSKEPDFLWLVPPNCTINSVPVYLDLLLAPIIFYLFLKNL